MLFLSHRQGIASIFGLVLLVSPCIFCCSDCGVDSPLVRLRKESKIEKNDLETDYFLAKGYMSKLGPQRYLRKWTRKRSRS